jgi:hypothetical protein
MDGTTPPTQAEVRTAAFILYQGVDTTIGQIVDFVRDLDQAGFEATEKTEGYINALWDRCEALFDQHSEEFFDEDDE